MTKIGCEVKFVENSITCLKKQLEVLTDPNKAIVLETVEMLEKEVAFLKSILKEENMLL